MSLRPSNAAAAGPRPPAAAFTLIELVVVLSNVSILAGLLLPALSKAKQAGKSIRCLSHMRQIGLAIVLYADEHEDQLPRSQHSAFARGEMPWGRAIAGQLGASPTVWTNLLTGVYQCPSDTRPRPWSYGQNVYFELSPDSDDYTGSPATWRRVTSVPHPSGTILHAENASGADHIMPHFWLSVSDSVDVAKERHGRRSNYSFVDGHAQAQEFSQTYAPEQRRDAWNPILVR